MYDDKYENFFLNITAGRSRFAEFASFTVTALQAAELPAPLAALQAPMAQTLEAFTAGLVERTTDGGNAQGGTRTENEVWTEFKAFVNATNKTLVQPAYYDKPADLLAYYPHKLSGLTQAPKKLRLPPLLAYVQAVQTHDANINKAVGGKAGTLLEQYQDATASKQAGGSQVKAVIATLEPARAALCQQLWAVHCTGLYAYQQNPRLAAALFDYSMLPKTRTTPKKDDAS